MTEKGKEEVGQYGEDEGLSRPSLYPSGERHRPTARSALIDSIEQDFRAGQLDANRLAGRWC